MVNAVSNWKDTCKASVCLIDELWVNEMVGSRHFLRILEIFDVVMLYYSHSVKALSERIGRQCVFLPTGIDTILFCPYPDPPNDSIAGSQANNLVEHRALLANIAKRSRYFIVNPGLIDQPDKRGNQIEIGNRYFEGSASGAIMVGERPNNEEFERLFDWPDAVIHLPYDSSHIDTIINELDKQPERQDRIRRTNVVQALMRHDWVYRWEAILEAVALEPMPQLLQRKERLRSLAEAVP